MGRIIGLILGGVAAFNGIAILVASDCESVSFDGQATYWSMREGMFLKRAHGGLFVGCEYRCLV